MDVMLAFPVADLRCLFDTDRGRRPRPGWPAGNVAIDARKSEFLPNFGHLQDSIGGRVAGWDGRSQFVSAQVIRLPSGFTTSVRPATIRVWRREFYGSSIDPRSFAEIKWSIKNNPGGSHAKDIRRMIKQIADLELRVPPRPNRPQVAARPAALDLAPAHKFGPVLAEFVRSCTTLSSYRQPIEPWLIQGGRTLCVLSAGRYQGDLTEEGFQYVDGGKDSPRLWFGALENMDVWVTTSSATASERMTELHLSRLQVERHALRRMAYALVTVEKLAGANLDVNWNAVAGYLRSATGYLNRKRSFKHDNQALQSVLKADLFLHQGQWAAIRRSLSPLSEPLQRGALERMMVQLNIKGDAVMGDKIRGSNIANRSSVNESFNTSQPSVEALEKLLQEALRDAHASDDSGAQAIVRDLVHEASAGKNPSRMKRLWNDLVITAPAVAAVSEAVNSLISQLS